MARSEDISGYWLGEKLRARVEHIQRMADRIEGGVLHNLVHVKRTFEGWAEFQVFLGRVDDISMHLSITAQEGDGPSEWQELNSSKVRTLELPAPIYNALVEAAETGSVTTTDWIKDNLLKAQERAAQESADQERGRRRGDGEN